MGWLSRESRFARTCSRPVALTGTKLRGASLVDANLGLRALKEPRDRELRLYNGIWAAGGSRV